MATDLPSRNQLLGIGLCVALALVLGTILEGGPTPEVAATLARWKYFYTRWHNNRFPFPRSQRLAAETDRISEYLQAKNSTALAGAYVARAGDYIAGHDPRRAKQDLTAAIGLNGAASMEFQALQLRSAIYFRCDRNYTAALADVEAMERLPLGFEETENTADIEMERSAILGAMGKYQLAISSVDAAMATEAKMTAKFAREFPLDARMNRAIAAARASLLEQRGYWEDRAGQADTALRDYDAAVATAPKPSSSLYNRRGGLHFRQGRLGAAFADYWKAWWAGPMRRRANPCVP